MRAFRTYVGCFLKATFSYSFSHTLISRPQMVQQDLRALMPALANKTYFNKTALPNNILQINCPPTGLSKSQGKL